MMREEKRRSCQVIKFYEFPQVIEMGIYTITIELTPDEKSKRRNANMRAYIEALQKARSGDYGASLTLVGLQDVIDEKTGTPLLQLLGTTQDEIEGYAHQFYVRSAVKTLEQLRSFQSRDMWRAELCSGDLHSAFAETESGMPRAAWKVVKPQELGLTPDDVQKLPKPRYHKPAKW